MSGEDRLKAMEDLAKIHQGLVDAINSARRDIARLSGVCRQAFEFLMRHKHDVLTGETMVGESDMDFLEELQAQCQRAAEDAGKEAQ